MFSVVHQLTPRPEFRADLEALLKVGCPPVRGSHAAAPFKGFCDDVVAMPG